MESKYFQKYADLISRNPWKVLLITLAITVFLFIQMGTMENGESDQSDMLPQNYEIVKAFNTLSEDFTKTESVTIVIELSPENRGYNDITHPDVLEYIDILSQKSKYTTYVLDVSSITESIKEIGEDFPETISESRDILNNDRLVLSKDSLISKDHSMALIRLTLEEDAANDATGFESEILLILEETSKPEGIKASVIGAVVESPIMDRLIGPEMSKTSTFSMIGIILVLLIMFRSIRYGLMPLTSIIFGIIWALGFVALSGMGMSSTTSGTISMIMGIGIDFGIQIISRFRVELKTHKKKNAMAITLNSIMGPVVTTTLAALIGFQAMKLGELTFMAEMGTIMSFGVLFCMLASVSIVPAILLLITGEKKK